jgi:hypothetical protein
MTRRQVSDHVLDREKAACNIIRGGGLRAILLYDCLLRVLKGLASVDDDESVRMGGWRQRRI